MKSKVSVSLVRRISDCGTLAYDGRGYRIHVKVKDPLNSQVDTLLHEWAHVVSIERTYNHGEDWGKAYAEIFRAFDEGKLNDYKDIR